ncbi:unnamed protein product, partial [Owenia fusiformis]
SIKSSKTIQIVVTSKPLAIAIPTDVALATGTATQTSTIAPSTTPDASTRVPSPTNATIPSPVTKPTTNSNQTPVAIPKTVSRSTTKQTTTSNPKQVIMATTIFTSPIAHSTTTTTTARVPAIPNRPEHYNAQHHMGLTVGLTAGLLTTLFLGSMAITVFLLCRRRKNVDPTLPRCRRGRVQSGTTHVPPTVRSVRGMSVSSPFAMNAFYTPGYTAYRWQGDGQSQGHVEGQGQPHVHLTNIVPPAYNTLSPRLPPRAPHGNLYSSDPTIGGTTGGATGGTYPTPNASTCHSPVLPSHPPPKYETLEHYSHTEYTYQNTQNDGIYESIASRGGNARPSASGGI